MPIVVNVDVMLARRKMRLNELAERVGITAQNLVGAEDGPRARDPLLDAREALRGSRVSAGRLVRVRGPRGAGAAESDEPDAAA